MNETSNQLAVIEGTLSIQQIVKQRELITEAMAVVMKEGLHYGKIAGCGDKPTLLQPGAQILGNIFRLRPEYEITEKILPGDNREYLVKCRLFLIGTSPAIAIGEGVGSSSSRESKHRYRNAAAEIKELADVPTAYWAIFGKDKEQAGQWLSNAYEGKRVGTKKIAGQWRVVEYVGGDSGKVENPNPTDVHNTVLKISKKRAFVDATITATASNDFFTQDLEDIRANLDAVDVEAVVTRANAPETPSATKAAEAKEKHDGDGKAAKAAHAQEQPADWRNIRCHFGKVNGPIKGKKLDEMKPEKAEWLAGEWEPRSAEDKTLKAAAMAWKAERDGKGRATGDELPMQFPKESDEERKSANLNSLATNLDYGAVETSVFMQVVRDKGYTQAMSFDTILADEAAKMMTDCDKLIAACQAVKNSK